ncbi:hypothetical protein ABT346_09065 [Micromonospora peucetia]
MLFRATSVPGPAAPGPHLDTRASPYLGTRVGPHLDTGVGPDRGGDG